ncbi:TPA: transferrin-binding protein-like solute binding protein [Mannheimia haemolytica]|uniref:factor H binding protein domain-containing protein n=1 Tax=Mannheimia haemolytica TaxID=75985 RepID=UPI00094AF919|nr:factor H binding protein domain-containing protein [Mannheimia haemolytica]MDW0536101.1 factor H binding family protein [Mannheimia haemolytica]MDW0538715.1 factor H binding family protein [Mannheimia haemolytica]MDW0625896.1 factor H binding family protein [Mannheimia haemolytica]MDW1158449.1 factor H binding family protein [Mannheimia haemolytica]NBB68664.1 nitrate ABC transporter ATP-binding protein [Mannheimia haemolytica]
MKKLVLVTALSLVLSACGSGGGGGGSSPNNTNVEKEPPKAAPQNGTSSDVANSQGQVKGALSQVEASLQEQVKALKQINVDGKIIELAQEPIGFVEKDLGNGKKGKAYNLAYSGVGYVLPKNVKTDEYGRVIDERASADDVGEFGLATKFQDLPKSGVARYSGVSFGANSEGKLALTADFANKQVSGSITERKLLSNNQSLSSINLLPTSISQTQFAGEEVHFVGVARTKVEGNTVEAPYGGKFMGPKAEEVIGIVADDYRDPYEVFAGQK